MSLLGFDALGRLALGEGILVGVTNTVLNAATGSFAESGSAASFGVIEATSGTGYALAGSAAAFRPQLNGLAATYAGTGGGAAFPVQLAGIGTSYALSAAAANFAARLAAATASFAEMGNAAAFSLSMHATMYLPSLPVFGGSDGLVSGRAALGQVSQQAITQTTDSYSVHGNAASFSTGTMSLSGFFALSGDPAPFLLTMLGAPSAYTLTVNDATLTRDYINWIPANSNMAPWAVESVPSNAWSPVTAPIATWTPDPAMSIPAPVSQ